MSRLGAVLFDMDGTLLRLDISHEQMESARDKLRRLFLNAGVNAVFRPVLRVIRSSLSELSRRGVAIETIKRRAYQILDELEIDGAQRATACADAGSVLVSLHSGGRRLGLITNNGRRCIDIALRTSGLPIECFSTVVSRDDVEFEKPHAEPLLASVRRLGLAPSTTVVLIGDGLDDMRSARAASHALKGTLSVFTVAVGAAVSIRLDVREELVDSSVASLGEIPNMLETIDRRLNRVEGQAGAGAADVDAQVQEIQR